MFKYKIITKGINGKETFISFDCETASDDIIMTAIEQNLIDGSNIQDIDISLVEVPRKEIIEVLADIDGWEMQTIESSLKDYVKDFFDTFSNDQLIEEFKQAGYTDPSMEYFELTNEQIQISSKDQDINSIWNELQKSIIYDVNNQDFTAIYDLLSTIPFEKLKGYLSE